jgi:hypothetical protein
MPLLDHEKDKAFLADRIFELVKDKWASICTFPEVSKHLNKAVSVGKVGPIKIGDEKRLGTRLVETILEQQVRGLKALTLSADHTFSDRFADFCFNEEAAIVTRAPIYNLTLHSNNPLVLEKGIRLIPPKLGSDEFALSPPYLEFPREIRPSLIFEEVWHEKKTITDPSNGPVNITIPTHGPSFRMLVFMLRLLGMFNFKAPFVETKLDAPGISSSSGQLYFSLPRLMGLLGRTDTISEETARGLLLAWKEFGQITAQKDDTRRRWFSIALTRMEMACERDEPVDMLLDLCISLEALLAQENLEVTYRFKQRGTMLLLLASRSLSREQLKRVRKTLGDAYDLRSKVVHGQPFDIRKVEDTNTKLLELVRVFSLKLLEMSYFHSHEDIISRIDLAMVSPEEESELEYELEVSALAPFWRKPFDKTSELFGPDGSPASETRSNTILCDESD